MGRRETTGSVTSKPMSHSSSSGSGRDQEVGSGLGMYQAMGSDSEAGIMAGSSFGMDIVVGSGSIFGTGSGFTFMAGIGSSTWSVAGMGSVPGSMAGMAREWMGSKGEWGLVWVLWVWDHHSEKAPSPHTLKALLKDHLQGFRLGIESHPEKHTGVSG